MLIAFAFECIFNKITTDIVLHLIENVLFAIGIMCPFFFLTNKVISKFYYFISYTFFAIIVYFETIYYYIFNTFFSSSAIFVAIDSNADESKEFISTYGNLSVLFFTIIFIALTIFLLLKIKKKYFINLDKTIKNKLIISSLVICILFSITKFRLYHYNLPYLIHKSIKEYRYESKLLGDYKNNKKGNFNNVKRVFNDKDDEVYVVIIGESTSRLHLGIYDYYRQTTPKLNKLKDQLLIYKDVISPHAYSVGALTKELTLGNYENPQRISEGSIIQLTNSVGFETYWLSNQRPIGQFESLITKISMSSRNHKFLSTEIARINTVLDEELLPEFDKIIDNNLKKKVIFIHLMGTHNKYEYRYPKAFHKFKNEPITNFNSKESFETINHYDNAILYNDFIISSVIEKLDSLNTKSFALYFSDHSEEVYDDINFAGHNEDIGSKQMFDIPFFIWQSKEYKKEKEVFFKEDRKYMADDLFHSLADLLNITSNEVEFTRSIFNKDFKERKRIIKDIVNYDTFFD